MSLVPWRKEPGPGLYVEVHCERGYSVILYGPTQAQFPERPEEAMHPPHLTRYQAKINAQIEEVAVLTAAWLSQNARKSNCKGVSGMPAPGRHTVVICKSTADNQMNEALGRRMVPSDFPPSKLLSTVTTHSSQLSHTKVLLHSTLCKRKTKKEVPRRLDCYIRDILIFETRAHH